MQLDLERQVGATFSPCRRYRYRLWRIWDTARRPTVALMLNPSTADEFSNDPTVERMERFARRWQSGGIIVVNLFAWRSTDPKALYTLEDPVGEENDAAILQAAGDAGGKVICAWGNHGVLRGRAAHVRRLLEENGVRLLALAVNQSGEPVHPLYQPNSATPRPYP